MSAADVELDDVAARALASIILERTADTIVKGGEQAETALRALAADTGLVLDVAAAVLMATSWLAGTGGIDPQAVFAASVAFLPDPSEVDAPETTPERKACTSCGADLIRYAKNLWGCSDPDCAAFDAATTTDPIGTDDDDDDDDDETGDLAGPPIVPGVQPLTEDMRGAPCAGCDRQAIVQLDGAPACVIHMDGFDRV